MIIIIILYVKVFNSHLKERRETSAERLERFKVISDDFSSLEEVMMNK